MNERIEELYDQCNEFDDEEMEYYFNHAKFAELIVQECAEIANKHMIDCEDINYGVGTVIRRTFGVE